MLNGNYLIVESIFRSISGEVTPQPSCQGRMTTFIRLAGCNLRCKWCDTKYAQVPANHKRMEWYFISDKVEELQCKNIIITGGEPLLQSGASFTKLVNSLVMKKYNVSIETNGSIIPPLDMHKKVRLVMDYKLSGSGMSHKMNLAAFAYLSEKDVIKFVIGGKRDFAEAMKQWNFLCNGLRNIKKATLAFSPIRPKVSPKELLGWMTDQELWNAVLSVQIHKLFKIP